MSELIFIDIKTLKHFVFKFYQTGFVFKVLEATGMVRCNGLPTLTNVESPLGIDDNFFSLRDIFPINMHLS